ncbi:hypothetical protein [Tomitella cavernea]|uniref:DUF2007 domain-containing protein n=1 Tax=Tomitella cavernea TaxID=1387982 RepID=A0ABP9CI83_9ACTN|nr:hypothetical protein [Tomitella cavernea]
MALRTDQGALRPLDVACQAWLCEDLQVADRAEVLVLDDAVHIELNANLGKLGPLYLSVPRAAIVEVARIVAAEEVRDERL